MIAAYHTERNCVAFLLFLLLLLLILKLCLPLDFIAYSDVCKMKDVVCLSDCQMTKPLKGKSSRSLIPNPALELPEFPQPCLNCLLPTPKDVIQIKMVISHFSWRSIKCQKIISGLES